MYTHDNNTEKTSDFYHTHFLTNDMMSLTIHTESAMIMKKSDNHGLESRYQTV